MAAAMASVRAAAASGLCLKESSLPSLACSTPSSLLMTAAVGGRRRSLRRATRVQAVRFVTRAQADSTSEKLPEKSDIVGENFFFQRALLAATASVTPFLLDAQDAYAQGGELGILEGRIFSLAHPTVMLGLFVATGWSGYLGWQWRRVRTIQDEINELKKQVPAVAAEGQAVPSPVEGQIKELSEVRKALVKGGFRDRHFNWGSILLGVGVLFSVSGAVNTYIRTGKLFPGPHLYAGVGITVLWALAAALVPAMQKGNGTARSLHIALNTVNLLLFAWQIPTGWEIVLKVLEFTKFP